MNIHLNSVLSLLMLFTLAASNGCVSVEEESEAIPLTQDEIAFLQKLEDPKVASVVLDTPTLFFRLNNLIREWQNASVNKNDWKHLKISSDLGSILTRYVYLNFDKIMDQMENGPQPNRVTAAAALGFSRIPETDQYPQVYSQAVEALLEALQSGDDAITQNALLGLAIIAELDTPLNPILPLMTEHHNPSVRSNAALCLSAIVQPGDNDQVMPYVLPALRDNEPKVRNHAILIILALRDDSAIAPLLELMDDRYDIVRVNAAHTLGILGDPSVCWKLIENLDHPRDSVRFYCAEALKKLSGRDYGENREDWISWWNSNKAELDRPR